MGGKFYFLTDRFSPGGKPMNCLAISGGTIWGTRMVDTTIDIFPALASIPETILLTYPSKLDVNGQDQESSTEASVILCGNCSSFSFNPGGNWCTKASFTGALRS